MRTPAPLLLLAIAIVAAAGCSMRDAVGMFAAGSGAHGVMRSPADMHAFALAPRLSVAARPEAGALTPYVSPDADCGTGPLVYASQYFTNTIQIYKQFGTGQSPCATIQKDLVNPQGMSVDAGKNVWVANSGSSTILAFRKGSLTAYLTLADSGEFPADVCVDSNRNVFATNLIATNGAPGSVSEWIGGKGDPVNLAVPNNTQVLYCALDDKHDLYVSYESSTTGAGAMAEFVGGKGPPKLTKVTTKFAGGLEFDGTQDLVANDQFGPSTNIYELPNPKPAKTFTDPGDPASVALLKDDHYIYITDAAGGNLYEYTYPGFKIKNTISVGLGSSSPPLGVATDPAPPL
jgi:DNA-binding beta-propeller fold protein YncE